MRRPSSFACASALVVGVLSTLGALSAGCASAETALNEGCVRRGAEALRTCARNATLEGVDVSSYQGTVSWPQIKAAGRDFAFVRISDGLNSPDAKFAQNWPAMKAAGVVRGAYQYFRPSQDPTLQAQMVIDKVKAAGGLGPADLPPVLDLESADSLPSSVVVANAKIWLAKIESVLAVRPIVYTAAFMSDVIGDNFSGYTLWVANYTTQCPTMPSGWTDWHFWQNSDTGSVSGISGAVDTDFFNGTRSDLEKLTVGGAAAPSSTLPAIDDLSRDPPRVNDGSQGATMGSGTPQTTAAVVTCQ